MPLFELPDVERPGADGDIRGPIQAMRNDKSIAIRTRVRKAMVVLTNEKAPFPRGWVKAEGLRYLEQG